MLPPESNDELNIPDMLCLPEIKNPVSQHEELLQLATEIIQKLNDDGDVFNKNLKLKKVLVALVALINWSRNSVAPIYSIGNIYGAVKAAFLFGKNFQFDTEPEDEETIQIFYNFLENFDSAKLDNNIDQSSNNIE